MWEQADTAPGVSTTNPRPDLRDKSSDGSDLGFTGSHFHDQPEQAATIAVQEDEIILNSHNDQGAREAPRLSFSLDTSGIGITFASCGSPGRSRVGSQNDIPRPSLNEGSFVDRRSTFPPRLHLPTEEDGHSHGRTSTTSLGTSDSFVQLTPQQSSRLSRSSHAQTLGSQSVVPLKPSSARKPSLGVSTPGYHSNENSHDSPLGDALQSRRHVGPKETWVVLAKPKRGRKPQPKATKQHSQARKRALPRTPKTVSGRRGPLNQSSLQNYRLVRKSGGACRPCCYKKCKCLIDPSDPDKPCYSCIEISPSLCFRYSVTDASLYREQKAPYHLFSKRWNSMDMVDITDWASDEVRRIDVSHSFVDAPYTVQVRQFVPKDGDMLAEVWHDNGEERRFEVPPYAIVNMADAAESISGMVRQRQHLYLHSLLKCRPEDLGGDFLWETYLFAFRYPSHVKDELMRSLITKTFSLWVACRLTSYPEAIVGNETLGLPQMVTDPSSPWKNRYPTPPVMGAQLECILYTKFLRPLSDDVRKMLHELLLKGKTHEVWLTVYLVLFVLLHSCAMLTRRDMEYARQINLGTAYANPDAIKHHQMGAITLLAHYHGVVGGPAPFRAADAGRLEGYKKNWDFTEEQENFLKGTYLRTRVMQQAFRQVRDAGDLSNEWYWISQLYDENWKADLMD